MVSDPLAPLLAARGHVVLDGAMATELEHHGVDTSTQLWSARALLDDPDAVRAVHTSYVRAGADVAITNTYQAADATLATAGLDPGQGAVLQASAVRLAREAGDQLGTGTAQHLVAGSVGPYGAHLADGSEYTGAYSLTDADYRDFHRGRIASLLGAGADLLAIETQPRLDEVRAILSLLAHEFPRAAAWVSFTVRDQGSIADSTPLETAAAATAASSQVVAIGVNCVPAPLVEGAIGLVREGAAAAGRPHLPVVADPNSGESYDPASKTWTGPAARETGEDFGELARACREAGACIIGGCCRTTPADVSAIRTALDAPPTPAPHP